MIVPIEVMSRLEAASKDKTVHYTPLAAANTVAVVKLIDKCDITEKRITGLINRAANTVLDIHDECKRLTCFSPDIPQNILDDARQLANLLVDVEQKCKELSPNKLARFIMKPSISQFVNRMNHKFDKLSIRQNTQETLGNFDTKNTDSTIEFGSNCDRAQLKNSGCTENKGYFDPRTGTFSGPIGMSMSGPTAKIKFGDNSKDVFIENSGNITNSMMPIHFHNSERVCEQPRNASGAVSPARMRLTTKELRYNNGEQTFPSLLQKAQTRSIKAPAPAQMRV